MNRKWRNTRCDPNENKEKEKIQRKYFCLIICSVVCVCESADSHSGRSILFRIKISKTIQFMQNFCFAKYTHRIARNCANVHTLHSSTVDTQCSQCSLHRRNNTGLKRHHSENMLSRSCSFMYFHFVCVCVFRLLNAIFILNRFHCRRHLFDSARPKRLWISVSS